jgi:DNA-binding transcriptional LysR family regulator
MRSLNPDQLNALVAVVETGGFTAAAKRLNLSQSTVSTQIGELEQRLGVPLVERLGRKAFATVAGREVIAHALRIAQETEAIALAARRHREGFLGRVRLGTGPNILAYLLLPVLKSLRETQPSLEVAMRTGITRDIAAMVARNELDLAIITLPLDDKQLRITPLRTDPLNAVFSDSERDIPAEVTPAEIGRRTLVLDGRSQMDRMIRAWLRAGGVEPKPAMELAMPEALRNVVAAGLAVSILPPEVVPPKPAPAGFVVRPLWPRLVRETAIIQRRDKPDEPALRIVRETVLRMLQVPEKKKVSKR